MTPSQGCVDAKYVQHTADIPSQGSFSFLPPRLGIATSGGAAKAGALRLAHFFQFGHGRLSLPRELTFVDISSQICFFRKLVTLLLSLHCNIDACCAYSSSRQLNSAISNIIPPKITNIKIPKSFQEAIMELPFATPPHLNCL